MPSCVTARLTFSPVSAPRCAGAGHAWAVESAAVRVATADAVPKGAQDGECGMSIAEVSVPVVAVIALLLAIGALGRARRRPEAPRRTEEATRAERLEPLRSFKAEILGREGEGLVAARLERLGLAGLAEHCRGRRAGCHANRSRLAHRVGNRGAGDEEVFRRGHRRDRRSRVAAHGRRWAEGDLFSWTALAASAADRDRSGGHALSEPVAAESATCRRREIRDRRSRCAGTWICGLGRAGGVSR